MNRRDFLRCRSVGPSRIVELTCERLYMRCLDTQLTSANAASGEPWDGEPPLVFEGRTTGELFRDLERELHGADALRVVDAAWLASDGLREQLDAVVSAFRAGGGRVDFLLDCTRSGDRPIVKP